MNDGLIIYADDDDRRQPVHARFSAPEIIKILVGCGVVAGGSSYGVLQAEQATAKAERQNNASRVVEISNRMDKLQEAIIAQQNIQQKTNEQLQRSLGRIEGLLKALAAKSD